VFPSRWQWRDGALPLGALASTSSVGLMTAVGRQVAFPGSHLLGAFATVGGRSAAMVAEDGLIKVVSRQIR
jgi:hypothetical protein